MIHLNRGSPRWLPAPARMTSRAMGNKFASDHSYAGGDDINTDVVATRADYRTSVAAQYL